MIRHWTVSNKTSSPELEGGGETIKPIPPCQCPEITFNLSQGFKFWRLKNHQIFQIIEHIIWVPVYDLIVYHLVMLPDFEKNINLGLHWGIISGHWQDGIGEILSPPSSWDLEVLYDSIKCLILRLKSDIIAVKVKYLEKVKSMKNSKIFRLWINGFYHWNRNQPNF